MSKFELWIVNKFELQILNNFELQVVNKFELWIVNEFVLLFNLNYSATPQTHTFSRIFLRKQLQNLIRNPTRA